MASTLVTLSALLFWPAIGADSGQTNWMAFRSFVTTNVAPASLLKWTQKAAEHSEIRDRELPSQEWPEFLRSSQSKELRPKLVVISHWFTIGKGMAFFEYGERLGKHGFYVIEDGERHDDKCMLEISYWTNGVHFYREAQWVAEFEEKSQWAVTNRTTESDTVRSNRQNRTKP